MEDLQIKFAYGDGEYSYPYKFLYRKGEMLGLYELSQNKKGKISKVIYTGDVSCMIKGIESFMGILFLEEKDDIIMSPEKAWDLYPEYFI